MFAFLGKKGVAILGLVVGLAGAIAQAPDAIGGNVSEIAAHIAQFLGLVLAAAGGSVVKEGQ